MIFTRCGAPTRRLGVEAPADSRVDLNLPRRARTIPARVIVRILGLN